MLLRCALTGALAGLLACQADLDLGAPPHPDGGSDAPLPGAPDAGADTGLAATDGAADGGRTGPRRVFVTSAAFSQPFAQPQDRHIAVVLQRADAICQAAADQARLGGTFRAWLYAAFAPEEVQPVQNARASGQYVLLDGVTLAYDGDNPTSPLLHAVSLTEDGRHLTSADRVWVGRRGYDCAAMVDGQWLSWATNSAGTTGNTAVPTAAGDFAGGSYPSCSRPAHLFCFEQ